MHLPKNVAIAATREGKSGAVGHLPGPSSPRLPGQGWNWPKVAPALPVSGKSQ